MAISSCRREEHHRRYATTDSQNSRSRPQRPMPLWLWQEVQILPWSTEIVALTCGTRNSLRPQVSTASLLRNTVRDQKDWKTVAFKQFHFFDPTGMGWFKNFRKRRNHLGTLRN